MLWFVLKILIDLNGKFYKMKYLLLDNVYVILFDFDIKNDINEIILKL